VQRILFVLTVAVVIAAMMVVMAAPAFADCCQRINGGGNTPGGNANGVPNVNPGGNAPPAKQ
jgi:hypothetical protein